MFYSQIKVMQFVDTIFLTIEIYLILMSTLMRYTNEYKEYTKI